MSFPFNRRAVLKLGAGGLAAGSTATLSLPAVGQARRAALRIAAQGVPDSMEPINAISNVGNRVSNQLFDTLIHRDFLSNEAGNGTRLVPGVAESWERRDERTLDITLAPNVRFHNGRAVTVEDIAFTFSSQRLWGERPMVPRGPLFAAAFEEPEILDRRRVRIRTRGADATIEKRLASWVAWVVPAPEYLAAGADAFGLRPIGTGPFKFSEYRAGDRIVLEANDDYFRGRPGAARVTFQSVPEVSTRLAGLVAGDYDMATTLFPDHLAVLGRQRDVEARGIVIENVHLLVYQCDAPVLADKRIRQALNWALDRDLMNRALWQGRANVPNSFNMPEYGPSFDPDRAPYRADPARARALMAEAGYRGERISFRTLPQWYALAVPAAQMMQQMWRDVGLNVEIDIRENWGQVLAPGLQIRNWSNGFQMPDPVSTLATDWGPRGSVQGSHGWRPPAEYNALATTLVGLPDGPDRKRVFQRMVDIWEDEAPGTIMYRPYEIYGVRKAIRWKPVSFEFMDLRPGNLEFAS
jgi:peptide/nickel transport system substrate-binding protein